MSSTRPCFGAGLRSLAGGERFDPAGFRHAARIARSISVESGDASGVLASSSFVRASRSHTWMSAKESLARKPPDFAGQRRQFFARHFAERETVRPRERPVPFRDLLRVHGTGGRAA